jgi:predicted nuclease of predicted toxin-antitoxin system
MDVHVPAPVTAGLRRNGFDVLTAQENGARELEDDALLDRATDLGRVLFTQDEDLLAIASALQSQGREFAGVIYCHQLSIGFGELIENLELLAACALDNELRNNVTFLPLQ